MRLLIYTIFCLRAYRVVRRATRQTQVRLVLVRTRFTTMGRGPHSIGLCRVTLSTFFTLLSNSTSASQPRPHTVTMARSFRDTQRSTRIVLFSGSTTTKGSNELYTVS